MLTMTSALMGASNTDSGCDVALCLSSVLLFPTSALLAVTRPYALPSENALVPVQLALLAVTCVALFSNRRASSSTTDDVALLACSTLQTIVTVLRLTVKLYVKIEVSLLNQRNTHREQLPTEQEINTSSALNEKHSVKKCHSGNVVSQQEHTKIDDVVLDMEEGANSDADTIVIPTLRVIEEDNDKLWKDPLRNMKKNEHDPSGYLYSMLSLTEEEMGERVLKR